MRRFLLFPLVISALSAAETVIPLHPGPPGPDTAAAKPFPAIFPSDRMKEQRWKDRFRSIQPIVAKGGHDLVFVGDSITQNWEGPGKEVWEKFYSHRNALNLGYSGDRTEHVLWRLTNGELTGVRPKLFVVMIGTNNTGHRKDPAEQTAAGVKRIIELLQIASPESRILLLSIFPRDERPDGKHRMLNNQINDILRTWADGSRIFWLDLSPVFLAEDGSLPKDIMPDFLHPQARGYTLWAEAMEPHIKALMQD